MDQQRIFVIVLNSVSVFFRLLLTGFKISASRSEERNNRAFGKRKTRVLISKEDEMFISNNNLP